MSMSTESPNEIIVKIRNIRAKMILPEEFSKKAVATASGIDDKVEITVPPCRFIVVPNYYTTCVSCFLGFGKF